MNVKELKEFLNEFPENAEIMTETNNHYDVNGSISHATLIKYDNGCLLSIGNGTQINKHGYNLKEESILLYWNKYEGFKIKKEKQILFREHKGSLSDSMETVQEIYSIEDIKKIINLPEKYYIKNKIEIKKYNYDDRIKWDTYIIVLEGYGVIGFTNGEIL